MNPNLKWRALSILLIILFCVYYLVGLPEFPKSFAQVKENFGHQIKLGLDLQGGTHLILQVQAQEAIAQETDQMVDRLTTELRSKNIHYDEVRRADDTHILVRNIDPSQLSQFRDLVSAQYANVWDLTPTAGDSSGYTLTLRAGAIAQIKESTMTQSLETIERRINALGLTEPTIQRRGGRNDNEILVQLPGEGDPTRAKAVIQAGGQLELRLVEGRQVFSSESEALASYGGVLPPGTELVPGRSETRNAAGIQDTGVSWYVLSRAPIVTGRDLRSAIETRNTNNPGQFQVNFTLSPEAARRFGPFTETNKGRQMAIVLEHRVYSAPVINGRIDDSGLIEGNFSQESAHDLALVLRAGALPASIKYLEERTVGPSLGADSILLVFERIREELRNGKSAAAAVDAGFDKAFLTIIDTHVTTVVSAFFLFLFGTGPIRGFAITLTIGLIANVFTAIYVSKTIFQYHLTKTDRQAELSI